MGSRTPPENSAGGESRKALARRHQRLVRRYAPLILALIITGSFALLVVTETSCGPSHRSNRRSRDDGITTAIAHATMGAFRALGASDSTICLVFAAIALASFLALGWVAVVLWRQRPLNPRRTPAE